MAHRGRAGCHKCGPHRAAAATSPRCHCPFRRAHHHHHPRLLPTSPGATRSSRRQQPRRRTRRQLRRHRRRGLQRPAHQPIGRQSRIALRQQLQKCHNTEAGRDQLDRRRFHGHRQPGRTIGANGRNRPGRRRHHRGARDAVERSRTARLRRGKVSTTGTGRNRIRLAHHRSTRCAPRSCARTRRSRATLGTILGGTHRRIPRHRSGAVAGLPDSIRKRSAHHRRRP